MELDSFMAEGVVTYALSRGFGLVCLPLSIANRRCFVTTSCSQIRYFFVPRPIDHNAYHMARRRRFPAEAKVLEGGFGVIHFPEHHYMVVIARRTGELEFRDCTE